MWPDICYMVKLLGRETTIKISRSVCAPSLVYVDSVVPREGGRVIETLSTLGAPVWLFTLQNSLLDDGAVSFRRWNGEGGLLVQVNALVSR